MACANPAQLTFAVGRLAGKVVFLTGASSGIGGTAARRFAAAGALVAAPPRWTTSPVPTTWRELPCTA